MAEHQLEVASCSDFPRVDFEVWEQGVASELEGALMSSLSRPDPTGLGRFPLHVEGPTLESSTRRASRGWLRVAGIASPQDLEAARAAGAQAFEISAQHLSEFDADLDGDLVLASHGDPRLGAGRACALGGYDPLGALARDGGLPVAVETALDEVPRRLEAGGHAGRRPLRVDLSATHHAGGHAVQELAHATATLAELLRTGGTDPERLAAGTSLAFEMGRDVFDGIAKLRAARALWARLFGAVGLEQCAAPWIHVTTSARSLEAREPLTNVLRATTQVFAAAVGGANSIRVRPHDEARGTPSALGRRLALNLQNVLAEEAHLDRTADCAGGSHLIEARTQTFARAAWARFRELEDSGGYLAALRAGLVHAELDEAWSGWCARVAAGEAHVLGVTLQPGEESSTSGPAPTPASTPAADGLERELEPLPVRRDGDAIRVGVAR